MKREVRKLMYKYSDRYYKLVEEAKEARGNDKRDDLAALKLLQSQCRKMTAELWHTMISIGALDAEEIEMGDIKNKDFIFNDSDEHSDEHLNLKKENMALKFELMKALKRRQTGGYMAGELESDNERILELTEEIKIKGMKLHESDEY